MKFALRVGLPLYVIFFFVIPIQALEPSPSQKNIRLFIEALEQRCAQYGWKEIKPRSIKWEFYRTTRNKYPLVFAQLGQPGKNCTLLLGAVHGDELPTTYLLLKLAHYIEENPTLFQDKCIVIAPLVNPDGFFSKPPKRINANGVDINRNFPTRDWNTQALHQWRNKYGGNRRYYPGKRSGCEQETLFQIALIKRYRPQKILTVHSPLGFYDFDGTSSDLDSLEGWLDAISRETNHPLKKFGYFPGSLGNYAGHERNIFTLTLELPSSDPGKGEEFFHKFLPAFLKFLNLST